MEDIKEDETEQIENDVESSIYDLVGKEENPEENFFNKEVKIKTEKQDYSEGSGYFWTNYAELKTETIKTEDNIDIIYEDVKQEEVCCEKFGGKRENKFLNRDLFSLFPSGFPQENKSYSNSLDSFKAIKIGPSIPHKLSKDGLIDEHENPEDKQFNKELITLIENQDYPHISGDLSTNYTGLTSALKTEDDIDIVHEDVKPEIIGKNSGGKNENPTDDISIGTNMEPRKSHELSIDKLQQNTTKEGDGTDSKKDNSSRKKPTITIESKNGQMIYSEKKFKYCSSKFKQEIFERTHTEDKPFNCKSSLQSLAVKQKMLRHERVHTGEKTISMQNVF